MKALKVVIAATVLTVSTGQTGRAAELEPGTWMALNAHLKNADLQMQERVAGRRPFSWMDESPDLAARVRRGDVVLVPVVGHGAETVSHGLVHDWIGAIFILGATIDSLWTVVHDYDNYQRISTGGNFIQNARIHEY